MSKSWGQRVLNKKPAGSQRGQPARAAPEFFHVHRGQAEGVHNSQKYPRNTDLGGGGSPRPEKQCSLGPGAGLLCPYEEEMRGSCLTLARVTSELGLPAIP